MNRDGNPSRLCVYLLFFAAPGAIGRHLRQLPFAETAFGMLRSGSLRRCQAAGQNVLNGFNQLLHIRFLVTAEAHIHPVRPQFKA